MARKGFTSAQSNEHLRNWTEKGWESANANGRIDRSRQHLNFQIGRGGIVQPLDKSHSVPSLLASRLKELGIADPNAGLEEPRFRTVADFIISGSHEPLCKIAFGDQQIRQVGFPRFHIINHFGFVPFGVELCRPLVLDCRPDVCVEVSHVLHRNVDLVERVTNHRGVEQDRLLTGVAHLLHPFGVFDDIAQGISHRKMVHITVRLDGEYLQEFFVGDGPNSIDEVVKFGSVLFIDDLDGVLGQHILIVRQESRRIAAGQQE